MGIHYVGSTMTENRRLVEGGMVSTVTSPRSIPLKRWIMRRPGRIFPVNGRGCYFNDSLRRAAVYPTASRVVPRFIPSLQSSGTAEFFCFLALYCLCISFINEESRPCGGGKRGRE